MKEPLISIILTYHRKRKYIKKTIKSIKDQSYKNFQLICVYDDTDKTDLNYLKKLMATIKIKRLIVNKKNLGVASSRNIATKHIKGKYTAFIDADDLWKKDKIKKQLKYMQKSNSDISFSSYEIISQSGRVDGIRVVPKNISYKVLSKKCDIGLSSVLIKSKILKKNKFPKLKTQEDFGLWLKLIRKGYKFEPIDKIYMSWRNDKNSLSSNTIQKLLDAFKLFHEYENKNFILSFYSVLILSINKILN